MVEKSIEKRIEFVWFDCELECRIKLFENDFFIPKLFKEII